jgi:hypothetical protein
MFTIYNYYNKGNYAFYPLVSTYSIFCLILTLDICFGFFWKIDSMFQTRLGMLITSLVIFSFFVLLINLNIKKEEIEKLRYIKKEIIFGKIITLLFIISPLLVLIISK